MFLYFRRTGRAGRKGFAYTFLTPDQERSAGDVVRAFKQSGQKPPEELMNMWNAYKIRMEHVCLCLFVCHCMHQLFVGSLFILVLFTVNVCQCTLVESNLKMSTSLELKCVLKLFILQSVLSPHAFNSTC